MTAEDDYSLSTKERTSHSSLTIVESMHSTRTPGISQRVVVPSEVVIGGTSRGNLATCQPSSMSSKHLSPLEIESLEERMLVASTSGLSAQSGQMRNEGATSSKQLAEKGWESQSQGRGEERDFDEEQSSADSGGPSAVSWYTNSTWLQLDWFQARTIGLGAIIALGSVLTRTRFFNQHTENEAGTTNHKYDDIDDIEFRNAVLEHSKTSTIDLSTTFYPLNTTDDHGPMLFPSCQRFSGLVESVHVLIPLVLAIFLIGSYIMIRKMHVLKTQLETLWSETDTAFQTKIHELEQQLITRDAAHAAMVNDVAEQRSSQIDAPADTLQDRIHWLETQVLGLSRGRSESNDTANEDQIKELEKRLSSLTHQCDVAAEAIQVRINQLETKISALCGQSEDDARASQAKFGELEAQLLLLTRQSGDALEASQTRIEEQVTHSTTVMSYFLLARQVSSIWQSYFGTIGYVPDLPYNFDVIMDGKCPFWPDKHVRDTHILALVPAKVNGKPFTLNLLGELIQSPLGNGHKTKYRYADCTRKNLGGKSSGGSYWVLMTRDVLDGSQDKTLADHQSMVSRFADLGYEIPTVLEATTVILLHYVHCGERLLSSPPGYTRCQEVVVDDMNAVVGKFSEDGLRVSCAAVEKGKTIGVLGCRKI